MINAYMTDNLTLRTVTLDKWNAPTNSDVLIKGRFEFKTKLIRNLQGEQVVSTAVVWLPLTTITHKDKIIYEGVVYSILNITEAKDFSKRFLKLLVA